MVLVPGEGAVRELAPASADPASGDRVHGGRLDVAQHGPDPGVGEDRVGRGGEVRSAVADHELHPLRRSAEVHDQVAACCVVHSPAGCRVTPRMRMRRAACPVTAGTQAWVPPGRPAVKKSQTGIASAGERRNCGQVGPVRRSGAGSAPLALRISPTVDAATLTPSPASSPWILRYPHPGFSRASRRTRALIFRRIAGRPVLPRMDLVARRRRAISRYQRKIVSGVAISRDPCRRASGITPGRAASRARSAQFRFGRRGCRRRRTASWWRRIKISMEAPRAVRWLDGTATVTARASNSGTTRRARDGTLTGHQRRPRPGHTRGLSHGHGQGVWGLWHKDREVVTYSYGSPRDIMIAIL